LFVSTSIVEVVTRRCADYPSGSEEEEEEEKEEEEEEEEQEQEHQSSPLIDDTPRKRSRR
jgi:hypothetical protein